MGIITAKELKQRTGEVIKKVRSGERLTVTYRGRPGYHRSTRMEERKTLEELRPFKEAWRDIEETLQKTRPNNAMKKLVLGLFLGICLYCLSIPVPCYAVEVAPRISDREIIESLTRLEEGVKANKEIMETLRTDMGALRTELLGFMKWGFGLLLSGMFILVGFILWDRRSEKILDNSA
ncbi:MAG: hypothetical protein AUK24_00170 [Syntrophaceae bacterium CG2_30_49_12]|nr:MAG: hypothetical protein AUK24_00170 [Syntrophaceae bacterium CG2_30_49_12]PJA48908.1 MAG: hypothetical protein CO171_06315 [Syntrophobacterales bacterium CG_4_9_14_3_um_filter_49_8]PJC72980.1 MAG: hypothetical protein CO012_10730 [Syntrophobacterales bacterium CG_4_8_14_3_um_filter_49_14]